MQFDISFKEMKEIEIKNLWNKLYQKWMIYLIKKLINLIIVKIK